MESFEQLKSEASPDTSSDLGQKSGNYREFLSIAGVLASALALAFLIISFIFQSYQVDGPSMQTTLQNNDHLIVWKVARTVSRITKHPYIPHRGDVIVFTSPDMSDDGKQLVKRVIALPGEHVTVKDGLVTVYNTSEPKGFDPDKTMSYGKVITTTSNDVDTTIDANCVFVLGDNRGNSKDSRFFGEVPAANIVGKLTVRVLPLNSFRTF